MSHFVKLTPKEREQAYADLVSAKRPLQVQITNEKLRQGKAVERDTGDVEFQLPHVQRFDGEFAAIVTFSLPPDVFFVKTNVRASFGKYFFKEADVYRLQRRDAFRLTVPPNVKAEVKLSEKEKYRLIDVSAGGFSIEVAASNIEFFKAGMQKMVDLILQEETFEKIMTEIRNSRIQKLDKTKALIGFKFSKLSGKDEQSLVRIITDVTRTHFRY